MKNFSTANNLFSLLQSNDYFFEVFIDGVKKVSKKNTNPKQFLNVKVFAGDPYHSPANADVKNFIACQLEDSGKGRHQKTFKTCFPSL